MCASRSAMPQGSTTSRLQAMCMSVRRGQDVHVPTAVTAAAVFLPRDEANAGAGMAGMRSLDLPRLLRWVSVQG